MHSHLLAAKKLAGIEFIGQPNMDFLKVDKMKNILAMDAQPALVTTSNAGIPAFLSTYLDPKLIEVLVSPMKATEIVGSEEKKGDFTTETIMFEVVENTGEVSSYGDYNENGSAGINVDFPQRQSYLYQTITQWGERQLERAGLAKLDFASRINMASILTLNKFQNLSYFFGVGGLQNYGLLNDPNLLPALTPAIKAAGGTEWLNPTTFEPNATAQEVYADIQTMFANLQNQAQGLVTLESKLTLAMSPVSEVALTFTNEFKVNVSDLLEKNFPNLTVKTAPEYATASGNLVQMIADEVEGQRTAITAFTEKLRAHPVKIDRVLTFDKVTGVHFSGTRHLEDEPCHLKVADTDICRTKCRTEYGNPCLRFCPANVYEMVDDGAGGKMLHINASNCVHCKTCDIMDPYQIITWVPPEGGEGPQNDGM